MLGGTAVFLWLTYRFRLRGWLLASGVWGQFAALAFIRLLGLTDSGAQVALAFMPVVLFTLFMGFLVEQGLAGKAAVLSGKRPLAYVLLWLVTAFLSAALCQFNHRAAAHL